MSSNHDGVPLSPISLTDVEYPAWCQDESAPVTKEEIRAVFDDLARKFGFQQSSKENMFHHLLAQLDSRASRTNCESALYSLHASYIGGEQSNYKKWFFAAQMDLDEELGFANMKLHGKSRHRNLKFAKKRGISIKEQLRDWEKNEQDFINNLPTLITNENSEISGKNCTSSTDYKWRLKMKMLSHRDLIRQLALYLLCWGEANQIRFAPECLCFIFKCALDLDKNSSLSIKMINSHEKQKYDQNETLYENQNSNSDEFEHEKKDYDDQYRFLTEIINPLYNFLRDQLYNKNSRGKWIKEKDHKDVIGYDDINQLFWYPEGIESIVLQNGDRLIDKPLQERYNHLKNVDWSKVFYKTYTETRSWMHCVTNFNRFWIIHLSSFWFFTSFNSPTFYTKDYVQLLNNPPTAQARLTVMAFGGSISCLIQIFATIFEWRFIPREWPGGQHLSKRMITLCFFFLLNFGPSVYILGFFELDVHSRSAYILSIIQLIIALITTFFFATRPLGGLFGSYLKKGQKKRRYFASQTFTASFPKLSGRSTWFSYGLWFFVFLAKFIESYFFLTLSLRDPIRVLSILNLSRCNGDSLMKNYLCKWQSKITLGLMLLTDLTLFFLDTYLWYIICNCVFSIMLSFSLGTSILTPWKNIYSRLPKRIHSKILATSDLDIKFKPKILVSQIWNAIIISMYREHLLSIEHVQKLLYQQIGSINSEKRTLKSPTFFVSQDDSNFKSTDCFPSNSEAKRRISFFAQSLSTPITEAVAVERMPTFTVLVPHYSEKILLNLREIIKEESNQSRISILDYLKQLHPQEWEYFVRDTKLYSMEKDALKYGKDDRDSKQNYQVNDDEIDESELNDNSKTFINSLMKQKSNIDEITTTSGKSSKKPDEFDDMKVNHKDLSLDFVQRENNDLPFKVFGFNSSEFSFTLRTRIWSSLRTQTLYRTVSGFMNYSRAIKLLFRVENPSMIHLYGNNLDALENGLENMANRKFRMLVAMQRYAKFKEDEKMGAEILLKAYPNMNISYLLEEKQLDNDEIIYYSCLTNGYAKINEETGLREPFFKIRLSGNPILGDGKSDNQNHSIIFYRGEYIQVIDANQDNYLEECLKIRSILSDFEEMNISTTNPYIPGLDSYKLPSPVAIVGAREYIFSENIGVLGDIAAGKEQTFGTLFARTLAEIGGKLHYGHPDFLNAIFMTTRGGLSKAQKGLHLNEDIFAGMNALCRGGRIKHSDYYQCGKGRDLGFGTILNFTTKIGAGMGEQLLSREYYYLGTQLPIDRFLSFFYAHPGFHLNNLFISISVQLFFLFVINLGSLNHETILCKYNKDMLITSLEQPIGCYNIQPALHWVSIFVLSIFIVFFIAFAPLLIQELLEKGIWRATSRFFHHLFSMAPLFEVFVCQVYSNALVGDITFGDAKYIPTGRGFAISRISFSILYSRFVNTAIYSGIQVFLMLIFGIVSMWQPALLWFWITVISMCFAPFIFNPHQFAFSDFFIDYRNLIHWISSGNAAYKKESWSNFTKLGRARFTGFKNKFIDDDSEQGNSSPGKRPRFNNVFCIELMIPLFFLFFNFTAYTFINAQTGVKDTTPTDTVLRLLIVTLFPILLNAIVLFFLFALSFLTGPLLSICCQNTGSIMAFFAHGCSIIFYLIDFELIWVLEGWSFARTLMLLIATINLQNFIFKIISILLLTKEFRNSKSHLAWWTGRWYNTGMGWSVILQPIREYFVKIMESSFFAGDFFLSHFLLYIQTPIVLIPFVDYWHSMILFWLKQTSLLTNSKKIYPRKMQKQRNKIVRQYFTLYFLILSFLLILIIAPFYADKLIAEPSQLLKGTSFTGLIQPKNQNNNDTGPDAPTTILTTTPPYPQFKTVP
ncbi:hypothetical protein HG535_0E00350 [Zygotorulaspora mrakii]|uniref:1,3-beta-glucan synthase n=1 Tax=Zygotorulaspora mrakii TaxID=42260 RepID=A0A7H9B2R8_ZYGMR|nr:uncharacterized protein HG535_0E00350 [Zygotorulaspora mrakii]QLG72951.1 hypothetical protein HG535_0E00350 [Zygotorulaspora mrakii]